MSILDARSIKKVLEVIHLPNLRANRQSLFIFRSRLIIVADGVFNGVKNLRVQKVAANNEASSTLASFAMHSHNRILQKVILNQL